MKIKKIMLIIIPIVLILFAIFFRSLNRKKPSTTANNKQNEIQSNIFEMTDFGMRLKKEEKERISKLSVSELVDLFKTGDTLQSYEAASQLKKEGRFKKNFDLLLTLAGEIRGEAITEGLLSPIKIGAPDEEKRMVDKYLDFLESQLKKDKPTVPYNWAVRGIGKVIYITSNMTDWNTIDLLSKNTDPNKIDIPYANERATNIIISCMDNNNIIIRREAIFWFGAIGANDPKKIGGMIKLLNDQLIKEQLRSETEETKSEMTKTIRSSLDRLNRQKDEIEEMTKGRKF